jgi:hypothetical protein
MPRRQLTYSSTKIGESLNYVTGGSHRALKRSGWLALDQPQKNGRSTLDDLTWTTAGDFMYTGIEDAIG